MMSTGVSSETTRLMGIRASSREAWIAVRGNPSRMKDAEGEVDGGERLWEVVDVLCGSQFLDWSLARMRRKIISSGTRFPDFMVPSASRPGI